MEKIENKSTSRRRLVLVYFLLVLSSSIFVILFDCDKVPYLLIVKNLVFSSLFIISYYFLKILTKETGIALILLLLFVSITGHLIHSYTIVIMLGFIGICHVVGIIKKKNHSGIRIFNEINRYSIVLLVVFSLFSFISFKRGYINIYIDSVILNNTVHLDSLFHASIATMFNEYNVFSTGLHGLQSIQYHVFSHAVFSSLANILGCTVYESYGYLRILFFIPLFIYTLLELSEKIDKSKSIENFNNMLIIVILVFYGFLGIDFFKRGVASNSYFVSESFLVGLTILLSFLAYIHTTENIKTIWLVVYTIIGTLAKISIGYIIVIIACIDVFFFRSKRIALRITICCIIALTGLGVLYLVGEKNSGLPDFVPFYLFKNFSAEWLQVPFFIPVILVHYFYAIIAFVIIYVYFKYHRENFPLYKKLFFFLIVTMISTFPALHFAIPGGSGSYFTNISMFIALPILLSIKQIPLFKGINVLVNREITISACIIVVLGTIGLFTFGLKSGWDTIEYINFIRNTIKAGQKSEILSYTEQLKKIGGNPAYKSFCVYIPKKERGFWSNTDKITQNQFLIPVLSKLPGIYCLPDRKISTYGFSSYDDELFKKSKIPSIDHTELCREVSTLGFKGYIEVNKDNHKVFICTPTY